MAGTGATVVLFGRSCGIFVVAGALTLLSNCQYVGPVAIDQGRGRYNEIIHNTSQEQTLSNIVRAYNHEPISVMDVTEVDAAQSFVGSLQGAVTNIGSHIGSKSTSAGTLSGQVEAVTANGQYSETPTIRYQPLLGQPLVAQLVTPVNADSLGLLYDSSWKVTPLLDLAASYLTLDYNEFYVALNIISELYTDGALEFVAAKTDIGKAAAEPKGEAAGEGGGKAGSQAAAKPVGSAGNDALDIYLQPFHYHEPRSDLAASRRQLQLWVRLLWLYHGTQPRFMPPNPGRCAQIHLTMAAADLRAWDRTLRSNSRGINLDEVRNCLPNFIELRSVPVSPAIARNENLISGAPLMRTYSALGILKNATERPHPKIAFVTPDVYKAIRSRPWNQDLDSSSFYTLLPQDENPLDNPVDAGQEAESARIDQEVVDWIERPNSNLFVYEPTRVISEADYLNGNRRLGLLRRYILIVVDNGPPGEPTYISHFDRGRWYYIAGDDEISQKNFNLIGLFLTMMAIPSALPPLSPVINVGG